MVVQSDRPESLYLSILRRVWGYESFRPLQEEIIACVRGGTDTLALLPTGGGKSLLYQIAGIARGGVTLVITPLIALMEDQVSALVRRGVRAHAIHSGLPFARVKECLEDLYHHREGFLYLSPERLYTPMLQEYLEGLNVRLLAVDEAHCISQWGYDFRPSYRKIAHLRERLPSVPVIAVTATATPSVTHDIMEQLAFHGRGRLFSGTFTRENLVYGAVAIPNAINRLIAFVGRMEGGGIVYTRSRVDTIRLAQMLRQAGISAEHYHAGLTHRERSARQRAWMLGETRVMVATNAFGMGVDKPDVRFVAHYGLPPSLEEYYQEIGRAGRDGQRAYVALYFDEALYEEAKQRHGQKFPPLATVERLWQMLQNALSAPDGMDDAPSEYSIPFAKAEALCQQLDRRLPTHTAMQALNVLARQEYLTIVEDRDETLRIAVIAPQELVAETQAINPLYAKTLQALLGHYGGITREPVAVDPQELTRWIELDPYSLRAALTALETLGVLTVEWPQNRARLVLTPYGAEHPTFDAARYREDLKRDHARLLAMLEYATAQDGCRERILRDYFGELHTPPCGHCDLCLAPSLSPLTPETIMIRIQALGPTCKGRVTLDALYDSFDAEYSPERVRGAVQLSIRQGLISMDADGYLIAVKR